MEMNLALHVVLSSNDAPMTEAIGCMTQQRCSINVTICALNWQHVASKSRGKRATRPVRARPGERQEDPRPRCRPHQRPSRSVRSRSVRSPLRALPAPCAPRSARSPLRAIAALMATKDLYADAACPG